MQTDAPDKTSLWASHVGAGGMGPCCTVNALHWANGASTAIHACCLQATCVCHIATAPTDRSLSGAQQDA
jgi:hypothetical protein